MQLILETLRKRMLLGSRQHLVRRFWKCKFCFFMVTCHPVPIPMPHTQLPGHRLRHRFNQILYYILTQQSKKHFKQVSKWRERWWSRFQSTVLDELCQSPYTPKRLTIATLFTWKICHPSHCGKHFLESTVSNSLSKASQLQNAFITNPNSF